MKYISLVPSPLCVYFTLASCGSASYARVEGWQKSEFLHGKGQLQFSDNEGRQQMYTSCSYSSESICITD